MSLIPFFMKYLKFFKNKCYAVILFNIYTFKSIIVIIHISPKNAKKNDQKNICKILIWTKINVQIKKMDQKVYMFFS